MAKHHPDLIFCRKQPGVGLYSITGFIYYSNSSNITNVHLLQLLDGFVRNAMVNVLFVIRMFGHAHLSEYVMNAITDHIKEDV